MFQDVLVPIFSKWWSFWGLLVFFAVAGDERGLLFTEILVGLREHARVR